MPINNTNIPNGNVLKEISRLAFSVYVSETLMISNTGSNRKKWEFKGFFQNITERCKKCRTYIEFELVNKATATKTRFGPFGKKTTPYIILQIHFIQ